MKISNEVEKPMGNTELRLILAGIEEEIGDIKGIALDTKAQAIHTNGTVRWHTKLFWFSMGALPLLTVWAGWLTLELIDQAKIEAGNDVVVQAAVNEGLQQALDEYQLTTKK